jgi:hypothetical protein
VVTVSNKPTGGAKRKYSPPELGVDLGRLQADLAEFRAAESTWTAGWIDDAPDSLVAKPPAQIRYPNLYQLWAERYFAACNKPAPPGPQEGPPTPGQQVDNAIRQYGLGIWPGLCTYAEYRPETGKLNYTLALTADLAVLKRFRLGVQANIYEAGANVGYHAPIPLTRNTYLRALVNKRYQGGRWPDSYGLGIGTQF